MNRFRSLTVTALLSGVLAAGVVYAQGPGRDGGMGRGGAFARGAGLPLRQLNLNDTQRQQIRTLVQQHRERNRETAERLRAALDARRTAVEAVPLDEQLIRSTTQALVEAQTEAAIQRARLRTDIFTLLTPEQQAQVQKLQAERPARAHQRRFRR